MDRRALLVVIALLIVPAFAVLGRPVHADSAAWPVLLDANSISSNDALPNANFTAVKTFNVGAIIEANNTVPLAGVFAWQFAIIYDNTTVVPQGDPITGQIADPAGPSINFGSMTGSGQVNWAGRIAASQGFGNSVSVDPKIDAHHNEIQVFFTLLGPTTPAVTISPVPSSSVKGNLLANVPFELIKPATSLTFSIDAAHTKFVDSNASSIPGIVAGPPVLESIVNSPPVAVFFATHLFEGDPSCSAVTGSTCSPFAIRFDASASSDSDGFVCGPVNCTADNAAGYFWDFGDGIHDNVNAIATCSPPFLVCNQGVIAIHDYGGPGTFTVTLRVIDNHGATGSARDALSQVILNNQPSHALQEATLVTPPLIVSVDCGTGHTAGKPFNCLVSATGGIKPYSGIGTFSVTEPVKGVFTETFKVTDSDGVNATGSTSESIAPQPLVVTVSCNSIGPITAGKPFTCAVSATGGTAPYSGTGTFTIVEPAKGTFTESFTVTDANAQTASGSATINVTPQPLVVTVTCPATGLTTGKPFNCTVTSSGGTSPYAGTGEFSVTERIKGSFTESFSVTDANGVTASGSAIVTIEPQPLVVQVGCGTPNTAPVTAGKPFNCSVSAVGGTTPYSGIGTFSIMEPVKGIFVETFTVTDANGISASGSTSLAVAAQPLLVTVACASSTSSQVTAGKPFDCNVSATGGTGPYSGTGAFTIVEAVKGTFTKTFTVTDANGIVVSGSTSVVVLPQPLLVTVSCPSSSVTAGKPFSCNVFATGGTSPYIGVGVFSVTERVKGTFAETFSVADSNGVGVSGSTSVTVAPQPLVVTVSCGTPTAAPITSGKPFNCSVSAAGGSQPYSGTGTFTVTEPVKGSFNERFSVTDANGLSSTGSATVNVAPQPVVVTASCGSPGAVITAGKPFDCIISASGGSQPYSGTGTFSIVEPAKGTITETFSVTDANNVVDIVTTIVSVEPQPLVVLVTCPSSGTTAGKPFNCTVSANGGTSPYTGTGTFSRTEAIKGSKTESFTVIDANSVPASGSTSVIVTAQPLVVDVSCPPNATAGAAFDCIVAASGGTGPYAGTGTFSKTEPTKGSKTESFTVTDANGANALASATVNVQGTPLIVNASCPVSGVTVGKPFNCTVTATGDTGPYQGIGDFSRTESTKGTKTETFSVTDANGVTATATASVTVRGQPLVVTVSCPSSDLTSGKPFGCVVSAAGGTTPYSGTGTFQVTESAKGVFTETFGVADANGAVASGSASVTISPQPLVANVSCPPAGVTAGKPFGCTVSATGGTAPYSGIGSFTMAEPVKGTFTESFQVSDSNGVSTIGSAVVNVGSQPLVVTVTCGLPNSAATAGKPFNCTVSAAGGTSPYTGTGTFHVTEAVKGLFTESFSVMDSNGVTAFGSGSIVIGPQPIVATAICDSSPTITAGKPFACIVSASGGTAPYVGTGIITRVEQVKGVFTESFNVVDANGIDAIASSIVTVTPQPLAVTVTCQSTATTFTAGKPFNCAVSANGGTAPYLGTGTFSMTEPVKGLKTEIFTIIDSNGLSASGSATVNVSPQPLTISVSCGVDQTVGKPFSCSVSAAGGTAPYTGTGLFPRQEPAKGQTIETFTVIDANQVSATGFATVNVAPQPLVVAVICDSSVTTGKPFNCNVTATGGTSPYTGTGTFIIIEPLKGSMTESFSVTDANGVSTSGSAVVAVAPQPITVAVDCGVGQTAGKPFNCTVSAAGGTGPYAGTGTFSVTEPVKGSKSESFSVTDSNGISVIGSSTVNIAPQPLVVSVSCGSGHTVGKPFACSVSANGGTSPYSGTGTFSLTQAVKGSFTESFTVTDANGGSGSGSTTVSVVSQPLAVTAACPASSLTAGKPFNCTVAATGGTLPYTGTGSISRTEPVKGSMVETFTVTDANGVTASATATVSVTAQPLLISVSCPVSGVTAGKPFDCIVSSSGGTVPYIGTGAFTRNEASKGIFAESFILSDSNGVSASGSTSVVVLGQPLIVSVTCPSSGLTSGKPFSCNVSAIGGTSPYTGTGVWTVTETVKGLFSETFSVTDSNGAIAAGSATVTIAAQPLVVSVACPTAGVTAGKPFNCTVDASGGTLPYSGIGTRSLVESIKGLKVESFTVQDANGISATGTATVTVSGQPLVVSASCPSSGVTSGKPVDCTVTASGGTTPYTGAGSISRTEATKGSRTESFTVTDANGASAIATATVIVVAQPLIVSVVCPTTASVGVAFSCDVSATGGTAPYSGIGSFSRVELTKGSKTESFSVSDANAVSASGSALVSVQVTPLIVTVTCPSSWITAGKPFDCTVEASGDTGPYAGTGTFSRTEASKGTRAESFTVTDANAVSASGSATVTVNAQPLVVSVSCQTSGVTAGKPFDCTVTASGGSGPYTGTGTFSRTEPTKGTKIESFTVIDANAVGASSSASVSVAAQPLVVTVSCPASGVIAGDQFNCTVTATGGSTPYTGTGTLSRTEPTKGTKTESFSVTDANSASATGSASVLVAGQPTAVTVTCPTSGVTAGKPFSCTVSATGGTAPYTGTGTFSRTEPVKGTKTESFTVMDANGVSASGSASVSVAAQPLIVTVTCPTSGLTAGKSFNCTVNAAGGTGPYTGTGTISRTESTKGTKTESFTVTDAKGASASGSASVTVAAQPLVVTVSCPTNATAGVAFNCTVSATGGSTPYTGTGTFSRTEPTKGSKTESFTVTDANTVSASGSATVNVQGTALVVTVSCPTLGVTASKPFNCTVAASGDTGPYSGTGTISRTENTKGTKTESFTVTDANSVTATGSAMVTVSGQPLVATVSCPTTGITVGKPFDCTVSATGGTSPYLGVGTSSRTVSSKGTAIESFTVTDANGVVATTTATVTVAPQPLVVTVSCSSNVTTGVSFNCSVSATGGTAPYTGTGIFPAVQSVKGMHTESFTVTDANNAVASGSATVNVANTPLIVTVTCPASASVGVSFSCTVAASGDTGPYNGVGSFSITENSKGNKIETFSVTDANGVSGSSSATVFVQGQPLVVTVLCPNSATAGTVFYCTVSASGGTGPYTGTGSFSVDESGKGSRIESFTVVDANGSSASGSATVLVSPMPLLANFSISSNPTQGSPVTFTATASGGTTPYTFIWDFGDGDTGADNPATHTYVVGGGTVFNVSLVVVDANGVHAGSFEESITVWVPNIGDFSLDASSPVSFVAGSTGTSHVTVSSMDGFSNPVHLSYNIDHTGLSCSMSPVDLPTGAGSSTVSCQGSVGSYDVTVTGSSGSVTHSRHVTVTVTTAQPESPGSPGIFGLAPMWFYGGLVALAIMLASILALRRRSKRNGKPQNRTRELELSSFGSPKKVRGKSTQQLVEKPDC